VSYSNVPRRVRPKWPLAVRVLRLRIVYLGLGDKERALDGLDQAYEAGSQWVTWLKVDQMFDPLRSEPRFIALLKKVGLGPASKP
jgi:hypothetical protein